MTLCFLGCSEEKNLYSTKWKWKRAENNKSLFLPHIPCNTRFSHKNTLIQTLNRGYKAGIKIHRSGCQRATEKIQKKLLKWHSYMKVRNSEFPQSLLGIIFHLLSSFFNLKANVRSIFFFMRTSKKFFNFFSRSINGAQIYESVTSETHLDYCS